MSELVIVGGYVDRISAELAGSILNAEGIDFYVRADDEGRMGSFLLTATGGARLMVRAEDAPRALELLQAAPEN